ncbi:MAG: hypothetical protein WCA08_19705 [Desulfoferrobacter sp.]
MVRRHGGRPEAGILEIPKLKMLQNSPVLKNRGDKAENTKEDKTQSENQTGANVVFGSVNNYTFSHNIAEFGNTKPKPNQREAGANPRLTIRSMFNRVTRFNPMITSKDPLLSTHIPYLQSER